MKPLLVSSGEPAGIGPDICLALAAYELPLIVLADKACLEARAGHLNLDIKLIDYDPLKPADFKKNQLTVLHHPCKVPVIPGQLDERNSSYVVEMLEIAAEKCLGHEFSALITAPVNKAIINQANIPFTGHTEFLADYYGAQTVVMMLACDVMKVALATTHLPLQAVSKAITKELLVSVVNQLNKSLQNEFGIAHPRILVAGLNPHAGEGGYLGKEEIEVIAPALNDLKNKGIDLSEPLPADTLFTPKNIRDSDVFLVMYHDQGLPVLKYAGFGQAVNITLGLPIIRTSVDHGTALELAGTGLAEYSSLLSAVNMAWDMAKKKASHHANY